MKTCSCKTFFYPPRICTMLELAPSACGFPGGKLWWVPRVGAAAARLSPCPGWAGVPYLGPWVLRLPMDCAERLPATLALAGEDQPVDDAGQDLMLSVGSRLSTEPTLEQASLRGEERPC